MSVSKIYLAVYARMKAQYPKIGADAWASTAAEIVKRDLAAMGADGRVTFDPRVSELAPRLGPEVQIPAHQLGERDRMALYAQQMARQSDTPPTLKRAPSTDLIENPQTPQDKAHNAAIYISRFENGCDL